MHGQHILGHSPVLISLTVASFVVKKGGNIAFQTEWKVSNILLQHQTFTLPLHSFLPLAATCLPLICLQILPLFFFNWYSILIAKYLKYTRIRI